MTLCAYEVDCADVLDLTREEGRRKAKIDIDALRCPWEAQRLERIGPPTWSLADALVESGIAAVIVPSFADRASGRDANVVFWRWSDVTPHKVSVIDDFGRLPADDSSWPTGDA